MISATQVYIGPERSNGFDRASDTRQTIPGGSLTALVPVAQVDLPTGDYVLTANIDLGPTLPIAQQYTCQLKMANQTDPVDSLPIIYGLQTRLSLSGVVRVGSPAPLVLSCGSDGPARLLKGRLNVLHVDQINPTITGVAILN